MMRCFRTLHLARAGVEHDDDIHLIVGTTKWKNSFTNDIFSRIRQIKPKRIYIDEFQLLASEFVTKLRKEHDDKIYAYGTLFGSATLNR